MDATMNTKPDNNTDDTDFAAAAERLIKAAPVRLLCQIIPHFQTIEKLRANHVPWSDIAQLFRNYGITIAEGTLRNYVGRIRHAIQTLPTAAEDTTDPAYIERIYKSCCAYARSPHSHAPPDRPITARPAAPPKRTTPITPTPAPKISLIRNPDEEL
jgi:hypothetical protein